MKKVILVRYGEIILKGLNRPVFEDKLVKDIKKVISDIGNFDVMKSQGRIFVEERESQTKDASELFYSSNIHNAYIRLKKVFGIISISLASKINTDLNILESASETIMSETLGHKNASFKVETKRADKHFPLKSPEISAHIGALLISRFPNLKVDVINPDFILYIEIREQTYLYTAIDEAAGGLPSGINGKGMLLISGGIDSPVAGWMLAKRGMEIEAVHFESYPYTTEHSREKVIELIRILSGYSIVIRLHIIRFTEIQEQIHEKCPHDQMTIIMRRFMMRIAEKIAVNEGCHALATGESLGQVASQTMQGLSVTDAVVGLPVFRPLIGMDKTEIVSMARKIGTFDTSILPYEDCCTLFVAKHPVTRPRKSMVEEYESVLDIDDLIRKSCQNHMLVSAEYGKIKRRSVQA